MTTKTKLSPARKAHQRLKYIAGQVHVKKKLDAHHRALVRLTVRQQMLDREQQKRKTTPGIKRGLIVRD